MTTPPDAKAVITLTVYLIGLALTFGVRTWQHHRRTGDSGIRRIAPDSSKEGRLGCIAARGRTRPWGSWAISAISRTIAPSRVPEPPITSRDLVPPQIRGLHSRQVAPKPTSGV